MTSSLAGSTTSPARTTDYMTCVRRVRCMIRELETANIFISSSEKTSSLPASWLTAGTPGPGVCVHVCGYLNCVLLILSCYS